LTSAARVTEGDGTAAGVNAAFAVWNVVTTFSDNDISARGGRRSADSSSLVPSNSALAERMRWL
jgi:hypothetical protein